MPEENSVSSAYPVAKPSFLPLDHHDKSTSRPHQLAATPSMCRLSLPALKAAWSKNSCKKDPGETEEPLLMEFLISRTLAVPGQQGKQAGMATIIRQSRENQATPHNHHRPEALGIPGPSKTAGQECPETIGDSSLAFDGYHHHRKLWVEVEGCNVTPDGLIFPNEPKGSSSGEMDHRPGCYRQLVDFATEQHSVIGDHGSVRNLASLRRQPADDIHRGHREEKQMNRSPSGCARYLKLTIEYAKFISGYTSRGVK